MTSDPSVQAGPVRRAPLPVRDVPITQDAVQPWLQVAMTVFMNPDELTAERLAARLELYRDQRLSGGYDGDQVVGTFRSWDTALTVPAGPGEPTGQRTVPADAISSVTVLPTHRRRGVLTAMMTRDLAAAADRGLSAAVLLASEAPIYGRFGFGAATRNQTLSVDVRAAALHPRVPAPAGSVQFATEDEVRALAPQVHARCRRPGEIERTDPFWDITFGQRVDPGSTRQPRRAFVHRDDAGQVDGYLLYRSEERWQEKENDTVVHLVRLEAAGVDAYVALWDLLLNLDLVVTVRAPGRPVDEPLPWLLSDARAVRSVANTDFLWVRVLDPAALLSARGYQAGVDAGLVVEVQDRHGWAAGRLRLEVAGGSGRCVATEQDPEVTLDVAALGSCVLGDGDLPALAMAGLVTEHRPGALAELATVLRTPRAPHATTHF